MRPVLDVVNPFRTVAVLATAATLLGSMSVFISDAAPSRVVATSVCYGAILGWLSVGLALSAGQAHARWLWRSSLVPLFGSAVMMAGLYQRFGAATSWWLLTGGIWFTLIVSVLWLTASCVIAGLGWCAYIRRRWASQTAGPCREPNR